MKSQLKLFGAIGLLLVFMVGCADNPTNYQQPPADGRVVGEVHGVVIDSYTQERVAGVQVQTIINGETKTVTTDSMGYYLFTNLKSGEYELTIMADGNYSTAKTTIMIPDIATLAGDNPSKKDYEYSLAENIALYKKNAGVSGMVYSRTAEGDLMPAEGVTVVARFIGFPVEPAVYKTTTNSEGKFLFDQSLPSTPNVSLFTLPYTTSDNINYDAGSIGSVNLTPEVNVNAGNIITDIATSDVLVLSGIFGDEDVPTDSNLEFVFSKEINVTSVDINLYSYSSGQNLQFDSQWSSGNSAVTIDPYVILQENSSYMVSINGRATDNSTFAFSGDFETAGPEAIELVQTNLILVDGEERDDFPVNEDITMEFNVGVDTANSSFTLRDNSTFNNLQYDLILTDNNRTVTINPQGSMSSNTSHTMSYDVTSAGGRTTSGSIDFQTEE